MQAKRICLFLLITICLSLPLNLVLAEERHDSMLRIAQLDDVVGEVYVKKGGGLKEFPAYNGMSLLEGDFVKTHSGSGVTIVFEEDRTTLGEHTQVYLARLKNVEDAKETVLKQWSGQTWNKVKSLLNADDTHDIETATSVMGVRGTLFLVTIDPVSDIERLVVLEGLVENKLMREYRSNQNGQGVSVSEQMDISLETRKRITSLIHYDDFVQRSDIRIISEIFHDVLERADELYLENENSIFENADMEMERILRTLQSEMMLESLDEFTQAIERTNGGRHQQIEEQLEQRMLKNLDELQLEILEKRLRQIEQYERLRKRAVFNGVSDGELDAFIEQQGGIRTLERTQQIADIRKNVEERLKEISNDVQKYDASMIDTSNHQQSNINHPILLPDVTTPPRNGNDQRLPEEREPGNDTVVPVEDIQVKGSPSLVGEDDPVREPPLPEDEEEPVEEIPLPEGEEEPVEETSPTEDEEELVEETPPIEDEEDPVEVTPLPEDEEDPVEETPPAEDEEEPGVTIPEVNSIGPAHLGFNHMIETKSIEEFLVDKELDNVYQFTGLSEHDTNIAEIIFDQSKTEMTIKGKAEGTTDVTVQIIDENEQIEPVTVTFTVYVESVLPDAIEISEEYRDLLIVTYEHGTDGEQNDRLHISVRDGLNGYLNGWLMDDISLWLIDSDQIPVDSSTPIEDSRVRFAILASCSQGAFMYQIPSEICLDISAIKLFESNALTIAPIIDPFDVKIETTNGDGLIIRDFDENGHSIVTTSTNDEEHLKIWKVTYEKNGVIQTEDFRDFLIAQEMDHQDDSVFSSLLECEGSNGVGSIIASELCIANVAGIKEITAVFGGIDPPELIIENEKDIPVEIEFLADGNIIKLFFTEETQVISRLFEINTNSSTKMVEHPEIPKEYYLYSDEDIHISIGFVGVPVEIELDGSEDQMEEVGSINQQFDYFQSPWGGFEIDYWLMALPKDGYMFKHWIITWNDEPMIEDWEEINISDYIRIDAEVLFKAVFEEMTDGS